MRDTHIWPGRWSSVPPQISDHPEGARLAWVVRGYPFNHPILAQSFLGVRRCSSWTALGPKHEPFVRVELSADNFHGVDASTIGWFKDLEWLGPIEIPEV